MFNAWIPRTSRGTTSTSQSTHGTTIKTIMAILLLIPALGYATSWPTFTPPSFAFLMGNNMINTADCPAGQGKITPNLKLNMQQHFCRRYCPDTWEWVLADNQTCHPLSDFEFQHYEFNYVRHGEDENETLYTELTAYYGRVDSRLPAFKFTFTSEKDNHWRCSEMNPEIHSVICANDM